MLILEVAPLTSRENSTFIVLPELLLKIGIVLFTIQSDIDDSVVVVVDTVVVAVC